MTYVFRKYYFRFQTKNQLHYGGVLGFSLLTGILLNWCYLPESTCMGEFKNVNNYFCWGYSYFSPGIKVVRTGNPFLVLAEILFCYTLKLLSGKTMSYKRQIIQSVMVWQHTVVISTHMWAKQVTPRKQTITGLWCGCYCNRVEDSTIQRASVALKTAYMTYCMACLHGFTFVPHVRMD